MDTIKVNVISPQNDEAKVYDMPVNVAQLLYNSEKVGYEGAYYGFENKIFEFIDGTYELSVMLM